MVDAAQAFKEVKDQALHTGSEALGHVQKQGSGLLRSGWNSVKGVFNWASMGAGTVAALAADQFLGTGLVTSLGIGIATAAVTHFGFGLGKGEAEPSVGQTPQSQRQAPAPEAALA